MKYAIFILASLLLTSCNPCKQVARHPECFPADTIKEIKEVVHYEKEYITQDSIIIDSVPCTPDSIVLVETKYKTIHKTITDTIYESREEIKINPVNSKLKEDNRKLEEKILKRRWLIWYFFGSLGLILLYIAFKSNKFKLK